MENISQWDSNQVIWNSTIYIKKPANNVLVCSKNEQPGSFT